MTNRWTLLVLQFYAWTYLGFSWVIKIFTLLRAFLAPVAAANLLWAGLECGLDM